MKSSLSLPALFVVASAGLVFADLPKKPPLSRYSGLWTNSPFTSKPPIEKGPDAPNPLDDYALIGVSPIGGQFHRISLINKKKPEERITVDSDKPSKDGFKVIEVIRKAGDPLGTTVRMSSGALTGIVSFDSQLLKIAAAPAPAAGQVKTPPNPSGVPMPPTGGTPVSRQPRPRVVPPPPPGAVPVPGQNAPATPTAAPANGGRPTSAPARPTLRR
jgi:hypothetical protein